MVCVVSSNSVTQYAGSSVGAFPSGNVEEEA